MWGSDGVYEDTVVLLAWLGSNEIFMYAVRKACSSTRSEALYPRSPSPHKGMSHKEKRVSLWVNRGGRNNNKKKQQQQK